MPKSAALKGRAAGRAASPRAKSPPPAPSPLANPSLDHAESKETRTHVVVSLVMTIFFHLFSIVAPRIFKILVGLCAIATFCLFLSFLYRGTLKSFKQSKRKARTNFDLQPSVDPLEAKFTRRMSFWRAETENVIMPMCHWVNETLLECLLPFCIIMLIAVYDPFKDFINDRNMKNLPLLYFLFYYVVSVVHVTNVFGNSSMTIAPPAAATILKQRLHKKQRPQYRQKL